jgi:Tfp pilus assembly protein PilN
MAPTGERITLKGQTNTVDSVATFLSALKNSGSFDGVQLDEFYQDDQHDRLTYKFSVSCQFKSPTGGTLPAAGSAGAVGGGPTGPVAGSQLQGLAAETQARARLVR